MEPINLDDFFKTTAMNRTYFFAVPVMIVLLLFSFSSGWAQQKAKPRKCIMVFGAHADDVD